MPAPCPPLVDLPTREYQPGLQMLHCQENSVEGGEAVMLDGFAVAETLRGPLQTAFEDVEPAYEALMTLQRMLHEPAFAIRFTYPPGDLVIFDNRRLLHARDVFEGTSGHRWLQGCYMERDEIRLR